MASDLPLCSHYTVFQHIISGEPQWGTLWGAASGRANYICP